MSTPRVCAKRPPARWSSRFAPTPVQLEDERDARSLERFPRADARELEEVWSSDRSRAEDHLALGERLLGVARLAVEAIGHASSPPALDDDASDESLRDDRSDSAAGGQVGGSRRRR